MKSTATSAASATRMVKSLPLHNKRKLPGKKSSASTAAERKRKSRANQTTTKTNAEKTEAQQRMITLRDKRRLQENALCLRRFLPQDTLDAVDSRVTDFEYEIISTKEKAEWNTIWEDPQFDSMLSEKAGKALAELKVCKALVVLGRGNSSHANCGPKEGKEDSGSLVAGSGLPKEDSGSLISRCDLPDESRMRDDIAMFKCICPKMYLNKFELKVAEFEISLLTSLHGLSTSLIG